MDDFSLCMHQPPLAPSSPQANSLDEQILILRGWITDLRQRASGSQNEQEALIDAQRMLRELEAIHAQSSVPNHVPQTGTSPPISPLGRVLETSGTFGRQVFSCKERRVDLPRGAVNVTLTSSDGRVLSDFGVNAIGAIRLAALEAKCRTTIDANKANEYTLLHIRVTYHAVRVVPDEETILFHKQWAADATSCVCDFLSKDEAGHIPVIDEARRSLGAQIIKEGKLGGYFEGFFTLSKRELSLSAQLGANANIADILKLELLKAEGTIFSSLTLVSAAFTLDPSPENMHELNFLQPATFGDLKKQVSQVLENWRPLKPSRFTCFFPDAVPLHTFLQDYGIRIHRGISHKFTDALRYRSQHQTVKIVELMVGERYLGVSDEEPYYARLSRKPYSWRISPISADRPDCSIQSVATMRYLSLVNHLWPWALRCDAKSVSLTEAFVFTPLPGKENHSHITAWHGKRLHARKDDFIGRCYFQVSEFRVLELLP